METTAETLARLFPQLAKLEAESLTALSDAVTPQRLRAGDELLRQGSRHAALYFLVEGSFGLRLGDEESPSDLGYLAPGGLVGEVAFFDGGAATATVMVVSMAATALLLDMPSFERLARDHARAAAAVCQLVCDTLALRMRVATERYDRLVVGDKATAQAPQGVVDLLRTLFGIGKQP